MIERMYSIDLQVGENHYSRSYKVVAASDVIAIQKAKRQARKDTGRKIGWRCTSLDEHGQKFLR